MVLYLKRFESFPVRTRLEADPDSFHIDYQGVLGVKDATVDLTIQQTGEEYYCQGTVEAALVLECVRCLKHFERRLTGDMDFFICSPEQYELEHQEATDDEDYVFLVGEELKADISDMVRQAITLTIPMMPLCSADCQGLCPQCGIDRNTSTCECKQDDIDPRWEGLRDLLER